MSYLIFPLLQVADPFKTDFFSLLVDLLVLAPC